jgi:hypothetical protein
MPDGGTFKIKEIKAFDTAEPIGKTHTVGAISLERCEKFRAQIQSLLLSFIVKLESCALEQPYRDTCWGGDGFSPS